MAQVSHRADYSQPEEKMGIIPSGTYGVVIVDSDYKENSKGTGTILKLVYEVIDGPFKGRKVFESLSLRHEKEQTQVIAQKALNSICIALGLKGIEDSVELHGKPLKIEVGIQAAKDGYDESNKVKAHLSWKGDSATVPVEGITNSSAPAAPTSSAKKKVWE